MPVVSFVAPIACPNPAPAVSNSLFDDDIIIFEYAAPHQQAEWFCLWLCCCSLSKFPTSKETEMEALFFSLETEDRC